MRSQALAALVGAVVAGGIVLLVGTGSTHKTTTVYQQAPLRSAADKSGALTAREIYRRSAPGVVQVKAQIVQRVQSPFDLFPMEQRGLATGSGFTVDNKGDILTNAHVIQGAVRVTVQFGHRTASAKVVGRDASTDLALLKVDPSGLDLHPLPLGDSAGIQVGDPTLALGDPFGFDRTLTAGIVSALQRHIEAPDGFTIDHVIQTDAPINPGNSGGPLLDSGGRVIGINSQIATGGAGNGSVGIGFAVPINTAKRVIPQLERSGRVQRAYLGVTGETIDRTLAGVSLGASHGVLVQKVTPGSPAAKAGIHGGNPQTVLQGTGIMLGGDVITQADGKPVASMVRLASIIGDHKPGDEVTLQVVSKGKSRSVKLKLATRPTGLSQD